MTDLVIAGGGPVGLAAALYAVRAGLSVVLYEPRAGTIDKACGEGLMPGAVAALAGLGVHPAGHRLRGIRYIAGDRRAHADFRAGPGLGVRLDPDKVAEYAELYRELGGYPYDRDPARPNWYPSSRQQRWADPNGPQPDSLRW